MAVGLLQARLARDARNGWAIRSAGTWAVKGRPASMYSIEIMGEKGIDLHSHRSHELSAEDVAEADLILTMELSQAEAIRAEFPAHTNRVYALSEMIGLRYDVEDPYGGTLEEYRICASEIADLIERGYPRIVELASPLRLTNLR
jgi:protein-tyrosine-phosphatase